MALLIRILLVCPLLQNKSRLDLVVFRYAAEHMTRISRIIKQPYGNALLVSSYMATVVGLVLLQHTVRCVAYRNSIMSKP